MATWLMHVPVLADPAAIVPDWWADAGSGGGWLWAHGSQLIDQIRVTLGEFEGVSASLVHVVDRPSMSADDGFIVHFRMRNGAVGVMQSTAGDRGVLVETRVTGSTGAAWIEGVGAKVKVVDAAGRPHPAVPGRPADGRGAAAAGRGDDDHLREDDHLRGRVRTVRAPGRGLSRPHPRGSGHLRQPEPATFVDGVAQMAVLDAIMSSAAAGGRWTTVGQDI